MRDRRVDARIGLQTVAFGTQSPTVSVTVARQAPRSRSGPHAHTDVTEAPDRLRLDFGDPYAAV